MVSDFRSREACRSVQGGKLLGTYSLEIDDPTNMIAGESIADLEYYIRRFNLLLIHNYGANHLKLNDEKTMIMILKNRFKQEFSIIASKGTEVCNIAKMKILGVIIGFTPLY